MKTYTTSRVSSGNRLFPSTITLTDDHIVIKDPFLFGGHESTTPYTKISTIKVKCPMIGFSDVIIDIMGADRLIIHGFTSTDVKEIQSEILYKLKHL